MATYDYLLTEPPTDDRARELWLQHGAGFIIFQDARQYAIDEIPDTYNDEQRAVALKAIDDAIYGLMMIIDGVSGALANDKHRLFLEMKVALQSRGAKEPVETIDLSQGDGMCMGFHGWKEDDFGSTRPATRKDSPQSDEGQDTQ